jgi:hypothetical protein
MERIERHLGVDGNGDSSSAQPDFALGCKVIRFGSHVPPRTAGPMTLGSVL